MKFDAPFGLGLHEPEFVAQFRSCAAEPRQWEPSIRRSVQFILVDLSTNIIMHLREMTMTQAWLIAFADALDKCPDVISREAHRAAIARAYSIWPSAEAMVFGCSAFEQAGLK